MSIVWPSDEQNGVEFRLKNAEAEWFSSEYLKVRGFIDLALHVKTKILWKLMPYNIQHSFLRKSVDGDLWSPRPYKIYSPS